MLYARDVSSPSDLETAADSPTGGVNKADLRSYWRTIRKRWPFVVLSMIIATVVAFVYTYRQQKVYEATCQIIDPAPPQVLPGSKDVVEMGTGSFWGNKEFYETQYHITSSRPTWASAPPRSSAREYDPDYVGVLGLNHDLASLVALPMAQIAVKPLKDSHLAMITVTDGSLQRAALIANTVADTYIEYNPDYKSRAHIAPPWRGCRSKSPISSVSSRS